MQHNEKHDEPLIRVMALHALAYCERLFYLEEVEEIRLADANVYDGRRLHEELDKPEDAFSLELASEHLGIRGKFDFVRRKSEELIVVEHKKGKSAKGEAWPADRLQTLAYSLLLAEHTGRKVTEAQIRYHADNRTVKIPINLPKAEEEVLAAVSRARELRYSTERPCVTVPEKLCQKCSLTPVCLPEEERFAQTGKTKPKRLFPPDDDRQIIHLLEQGTTLRKEGEQLVAYLPDKEKRTIPGTQIAAVVLHGNIQISTQALHY